MSPGAARDTGAIAQRMAGIHLRLGSLLLARAELEQLAAAAQLDVIGLAHLVVAPTARWSSDRPDIARPVRLRRRSPLAASSRPPSTRRPPPPP